MWLRHDEVAQAWWWRDAAVSARRRGRSLLLPALQFWRQHEARGSAEILRAVCCKAAFHVDW